VIYPSDPQLRGERELVLIRTGNSWFYVVVEPDESDDPKGE
jgi:hypothetical protein